MVEPEQNGPAEGLGEPQDGVGQEADPLPRGCVIQGGRDCLGVGGPLFPGSPAAVSTSGVQSQVPGHAAEPGLERSRAAGWLLQGFRPRILNQVLLETLFPDQGAGHGPQEAGMGQQLLLKGRSVAAHGTLDRYS